MKCARRAIRVDMSRDEVYHRHKDLFGSKARGGFRSEIDLEEDGYDYTKEAFYGKELRFEYGRKRTDDKDPDYTNYLNECNEPSRRYFCEARMIFSEITEDTRRECSRSWSAEETLARNLKVLQREYSQYLQSVWMMNDTNKS